MTTSPGIRVLDVPKDASERELKVYFSNPRNGGSKIDKIYYPLQSNDAVVLFQSGEANPKIFQQEHNLRGKIIKVRSLQRQVFSKVTVELGSDITALLDNDPKYLDDIQYDGELEVTSEDNYTITGDWYQIEWAWQYLDDVCNKRNETYESGLEHGREEQSALPVIQNGEPFGACGYSSDTKEEELQPLSYPHHTEISDESEFQPYCYENWQDKSEYTQLTERKSEPDYMNHFDFNDDNSTFDLLSRGLRKCDELPFIPRGHPNRGQQSGFTVCHQDFQDLPLTFDFNISTLNISIVMSDLLKEKTNAIVSSASGDLSAQYGLSRIIARAADPKLKEECREHIDRHGPLSIGDIIHTSAGGSLDKKIGFVMHAVGPSWKESRTEESSHLLTCTYLNTLQYASNMWLPSISMPLIGAGGVGFPLDVCVQALYDALLLFVTDEENLRHLKDIRLVLNDEDSTCATIVVLRSLLDIDQISTQEAAKERYITRSGQFDFRAKDLSLDDEIAETTTKDLETKDKPADIATMEAKSPNDETKQALPQDISKKQKLPNSECDNEENILISIKDKSASFGKARTLEQVLPISSEPNAASTQNSVDPETFQNSLTEKSNAKNLNTSTSSDESIPFGRVNSDEEEFTQTDSYTTSNTTSVSVHVGNETKMHEPSRCLTGDHNVISGRSKEKPVIKDDWEENPSAANNNKDNTKSGFAFDFGSVNDKQNSITDTEEHETIDIPEKEMHLSSQETEFFSKPSDNFETRELEKQTELVSSSTDFKTDYITEIPPKYKDTKAVKAESLSGDTDVTSVTEEDPQAVQLKKEDFDKDVYDRKDELEKESNTDGT